MLAAFQLPVLSFPLAAGFEGALLVGSGACGVRERGVGVGDVVGLDMPVVSVMLVEPKDVLLDVSPDFVTGLPVAGNELPNVHGQWLVGIDPPNVHGTWRVEFVAFAPNLPPGVEGNAEKLSALCEGLFSVNVVGVPKTEPVIVEDEGCTAALEMPAVVVLGIWVFPGEEVVPNSPLVGNQDGDSGCPNLEGDKLGLKVSLFEETAFMSKGLLADGALELLPLGLPSFIPKRPFADGTFDMVLLEASNTEELVELGDILVDALLFTAVRKRSPVELVFEL